MGKRVSLTFTQVNHSFGSQVVLSNVTLTAEHGEILCLLGPSGSGKTTLLRLAAGLEVLQSGTIHLGDRLLADAKLHTLPEQRGVGLVFQDHVLYPHLTVAENVAFGLAKRPQGEVEDRVARQLAAVDLAAFAARYPHTLSGGQQQRVALARAMAPEPAVMLLDEPFASVDSGLRRRLREQARLSLKATDAVTVVVTHDAEEAMELGDRIAYLWQGELAQVGTPEALWRTPASLPVAVAFGDAQQLPAALAEGGLQTPFGAISAQSFSDCRSQQGALCQLVVRPESVQVLPEAPQPVAQIADVRFVSGGLVLLLRSLSDADAALLRVRIPANDRATSAPLALTQPVGLSFNKDGLFAYDSD